MGSVNVRIDMREFTGKIRYEVNRRYVESVSKPGVKTEIYTALYDEMMSYVPVDTGALQMSPLTDGNVEEMGESSYSKGRIHYAQGSITDGGIQFNPYSVSKRGKINYYANKVKDFKPYWYINDNKESAYELIKDILVGEMNNG